MKHHHRNFPSTHNLPRPLLTKHVKSISAAKDKIRIAVRAKRSAAAPSTTLDLFLRPYQQAAFDNRTNGIECWLWGRQTGKSFTLAAWAVDRLITRPGRLVTILSNSLSNGAELNQKCAEIARAFSTAFEQVDLSSNSEFECMNYETRFNEDGQIGRIKILPANPRTARGFSGDLILDEFAFHEDSVAIWEAAEPILSANPDFLCRVASTPNGRHNMFYRLVTDPTIPKRIVPRSVAWQQGMILSHPVTRQPITPDEARILAHDKRAYDQNYECIFESENMALLTHELISAAEEPGVGILCDGEWDEMVADFLRTGNLWRNDQTPNPKDQGMTQVPMSNCSRRNLWVGVDVGRNQDLTVISVVEKEGDIYFVRAMLRLRNVRLPEQQEFLEVVCRSSRFCGAQIDMTGLGLGLYEYTRQRFGDRIRGLNFASTLPIAARFSIRNPGPTARAPEVLALRLLQVYESKRIRQPVDTGLREDLRKPERVMNGEGRVSIATPRSEAGHADHFWSLALAVDAAQRQPEPYIHVIEGMRERIPRDYLI